MNTVALRFFFPALLFLLIAPLGCHGDHEAGGPEEDLFLENEVLQVEIHPFPFGIHLSSWDRGTLTETLDYGEGHSLWYRRNGRHHVLDRFIRSAPIEEGFALFYRTSEGIPARVVVSFHTQHTVKLTLTLDEVDGWLLWGLDMQLTDGEAIYGGMERIHWWHGMSEGNPQPIGSLDRRGQIHPMILQGTISVIAPFYHSSRGFGLYTDTTFYGFFDLGWSVHERLRFFFQTTGERAPCMTTYLFYGPSHDKILDEYTALTGRPFIPPRWAFKHLRWRDTHAVVEGELDGHIVNGQVAEDVTMYEALGFPAGNYMVDRPWSPGEQGFAEFTFDPVRLPNADCMLRSLFDRGYRFCLWGGPWAIGFDPGQNGWEAREHGYFAPHQEKHIDFSNPAAFAWFKEKIRDFCIAHNVRGWKLDRGDEDQPSFWWDTYRDGRSGAEMRNAYPLLFQKCYHEAMREAWGDDFFINFRTGWAGSQRYGVVWGGDTRGNVVGASTDLGLRSVLLSQLHCAFMGFPIWGIP